MTTVETTFEQRVAAINERARIGYIGADSIDFFRDDAPRLVTVEVRGDGDEPNTAWHGEVVLTHENAGYAIWALSKSIGIDAEPMLKAAGVKGFASKCEVHNCGEDTYFEQAENEAPGVGRHRHVRPDLDPNTGTGRGHMPRVS